MLSVLGIRTYRHLFLAQLVALSGTGLATVALGLLAYDLAGENAGLVLGIALTIKMVAYVTIAPVVAALASGADRRKLLIGLDIVRASVAVCLPFVTQIWQIYVLVFLLQSASAGFTPAFQALIPDVLPEEEDYTKALSISRFAMDAESLLSPLFAAALLTLVTYDILFLGTALGFIASALLVVSVILPTPPPAKPRSISERTTRGLRIYLKTPRLLGLLALNWVISAVGSVVIVNTVVIVRSDLGLAETEVALTLAAFGAGSMSAALLVPRLLHLKSDRVLMILGALIASLALFAIPFALDAFAEGFITLLSGWAVIGVGYTCVLTPAGRVLTRSAHPEDRPAVFAAQFTLSHACWLVFYPLTGWLMTAHGTTTTMIAQALLALPGVFAAAILWPANSASPRQHEHTDLPPDHPHLKGDGPHAHPIIIDDLHPSFKLSQ
ncbi:MFS transporter [Shimia sp. SDUM112013]|uniref:MFS transporter n=1 Tax=Shimia sp. SDUM112013 TaxID=3136160 RepID=UPI0032EBC055